MHRVCISSAHRPVARWIASRPNPASLQLQPTGQAASDASTYPQVSNTDVRWSAGQALRPEECATSNVPNSMDCISRPLKGTEKRPKKASCECLKDAPSKPIRFWGVHYGRYEEGFCHLMKLTRLVVRLSALGIVAILALPFVYEQVDAFGHAAPERQSFSDRELDSRDADRNRNSRPVQDVATADTRRSDSKAPSKKAKGTSSSSGASAPNGPAVAALESDVVFSGTVAKKKAKLPRWTSTQVTATASGEHDFVIDWTGDANLRIAIREVSGRWVAAETSKNQPKAFAASLKKGTVYRIAVWSMRGIGAFTVTMQPSQQDDPPNQVTPPTQPPATTTTTRPPATTTTTTTAPPAPPATPRGDSYPGQPANGTLMWGASITGNGDPVKRHEDPAGHALTLRRTFFQWSARTGGMVTMARNDLAKGRLPWVSIKTPSWAAMGRGDHDAEIDAMLKALDALNGPVWLAMHHEPEGGGSTNSPDDPGGPAAHVEMNRRVRERMTKLGTDNIALAPILMSWTWNPSSGRNPNDWWAPGIYDFVGIDHYRDNNESLLTSTWATVRSWAGSKGVDIAVGEWGARGTDAAAGERVREWYNAAAGSHKDGKGGRVVGLSAFDSSLNSPSGSWELKGKQLEVFHELMNDPRTANPR